jgi:ubiquinone biosynthesis protein
VLNALDRRSLTIRWHSEELERLRAETRSYRAQMIAAVAGSALVLSGTGLLVLGPGPILTVAAAKVLAIGLYIAGGLLLSASWRGASPQK